ncbi:hypothetical protein Hamer_G004025, partial [Homarus americanus]
QPTQEDDVKPVKPTTRQPTEMLTTIANLSDQLEEYDTRPHAPKYICPVICKVIEKYKAMYMSLVNARQQVLITRYLCKAQPVNALANITLGDDDGTTDDDIEALGDLLVEELPQDFEGFDAGSPPCLRTHQAFRCLHQGKKKKRKTFNIGEKMRILDEFEHGANASVVARRYGVNKSTIHGIRQDSFSICCTTVSKTAQHLRPPLYQGMEDALKA